MGIMKLVRKIFPKKVETFTVVVVPVPTSDEKTKGQPRDSKGRFCKVSN